MFNRKGQLHILLTLIVALSVTGFAIWTFSSYENVSKDYSAKVSESINEANFMKDYVYVQSELLVKGAVNCGDCVSNSLKERFRELAKRVEENYRLPNTGNYFGLIRNGEFKFEEVSEGEYVLEFEKELFVVGESGEQEEDSGIVRIEKNFVLSEIYEIEKG